MNVLGTNGIGKNVSIELNNSITVRGTMSEIIDFNFICKKSPSFR